MSTTEVSAAEHYQDALFLARTGQFAKAAELLLTCVQDDPLHFGYVQDYLGALVRQFPLAANTGEGVSTTSPSKSDEPTEFLRRGAASLLNNPWQVSTLLALADAAATCENHAIELCYLELALAAAPSNAPINRLAGAALTKARRFDEALTCWQTVDDLHPEDSEALATIRQLTIARSRQRVGLEEAEQSLVTFQDQTIVRRNILQPPPSPEGKQAGLLNNPLPAPASNSKLTPVQQLEYAIREYPTNPTYYLQLAPLYLAKDRDFDAEKMLAKGCDATSNNPEVRQLWEEVAMQRLGKKLLFAQEQHHAEASAKTKDALADIILDRDRLETQIFVNRCKREPGNAAMQLELGKRLRRAGKLKDALQRLETALPDMEQKCFAAFEMGETLHELSDFPAALKHYRISAESASRLTQLDCKKQALYQAALLAAQLKLFRLAVGYLEEIAALDPYYKQLPILLTQYKQHFENE